MTDTYNLAALLKKAEIEVTRVIASGIARTKDDALNARIQQRKAKDGDGDGKVNDGKSNETKSGKLHAVLKQADGYGNPTFAHQSYNPIAPRRSLSPDEQSEVERGQSQWIGKLFPSMATPPAKVMNSPGKGALLYGLGGAGLGGLLGAGLGMKPGDSVSPTVGAAIGAGLVGIPAATLAYLLRRQNNEDLEELMKRLPPGATLRDIESDPVMQARLDRFARMSAGRGSRFGLLLDSD